MPFIEIDMVFFATDLHGKITRFEKLFQQIEIEKPEFVFIGGDFLPRVSQVYEGTFFKDFILDYLYPRLSILRNKMVKSFPQIYLIFGNDDIRVEEEKIKDLEKKTGIFFYAHERIFRIEDFFLYG